jgi:putative PEP-CTERM system TPR-repeat lipoprotein
MIAAASGAGYRGRMSRLTLLLVPVLVCALDGCARKTADDHLRSAEAHIAAHNLRGAEVELLNAVKLAPDNANAHRLRGENRLAMGHPNAAEADLRRALQLEAPPESVLPTLAKALAMQEKWRDLLTEFGTQPALVAPQAEADFRAAIGDAQLAARQVDKAQQSYQSALSRIPTHLQARLGMARAAGASGKLDTALALVDAVIADTPSSAEAHFVRAMLANLGNDRAGMQAALERALAASADHVKSRIELAALLIDDQQYDPAATLLSDAFVAGASDNGRVLYLRALLDARRGAWADARKRVAGILTRLPDHAAANALAGEIEVRSNNFVQAEVHLRRALATDRSNRAARLWLAHLLLRQSPTKALEVLQPMFANASVDRTAVMLAAEAHLLTGDLTRAATLFEAAKVGGRDDARALMRLGQIALTRGQFEVGAEALQAAATRDPTFIQPEIELVTWHLYRNDAKSALRAAEALKAKAPQNPLTHILAGRARMATGEPAAARRDFDAALALQAGAPAALAGLAEIDLAEGKATDAVRRYEARLAAQPDEHAFLALAQLHRRAAGNSDEAQSVVRKGLSALPRSAVLNAALVGLLLERRDIKGALGVADQFAVANPADSAGLETLADTQLAAGQGDEAATTLGKLISLEPAAPKPLQRLASHQLARGNAVEAVATLKRARALAANDLSVITDLAQAQLRARSFEQAAQSAQAIQERAPNRALGWVVQGDVLAAQSNLRAAENAFRQALKIEPRHTPAATKLCSVLTATQRAAECNDFSTRWLAADPGDTAMRMYVGDQAVARGRYSDAARQYEAVALREPAHVAALNNLAWSLGELRDARALGYAQQAARLAPYNADVLNTLGVLQLAAGNSEQGLKNLTAARQLAPHRADLRLQFAKGLLQADRIDEARVELLAVAGDAADPRGKEEAASLLKKLPARH